jgi:hypothetical protein
MTTIANKIRQIYLKSREIRLARLIEIKAPEVILENEKKDD